MENLHRFASRGIAVLRTVENLRHARSGKLDLKIINSPRCEASKFSSDQILRSQIHHECISRKFPVAQTRQFPADVLSACIYNRLPTACQCLPIACQAACPRRPCGGKEVCNEAGGKNEKSHDQFAEDSPRDERLRSLDRDHAGILHHPLSARAPEGGEGAGECEMTKEKKG